MTNTRTRDNQRPAGEVAEVAAHNIDIAYAVLGAIRDEAARGYPEEVCGVLIGRDDNGRRTVERAVPVDNARDENRSRRYLIPADKLRTIERDAATHGSEVVGFYHSHPDHPATPSTYDREHSWPWYTYVIVSVSRHQSGDVKAWQLADDRNAFVEQEISAPATSTPGSNQKPAPETSPRNEVSTV